MPTTPNKTPWSGYLVREDAVPSYGLPFGPDYRPRFPQGERLGIGILGCGEIAQKAHLPAFGN